MKILRFVRGLVGTAVLWGAVWSLLSVPTIVALIEGKSDLISWVQLTSEFRTPVAIAFTYGAVCGLVFALLIATVARRVQKNSILNLSTFGMLGATSSLIMAFLTGGYQVGVVSTLLATVMGTTTAAVMLTAARRTRVHALAEQLERPRLSLD